MPVRSPNVPQWQGTQRFDAEQLERDRGLLRAHRVVVADREHRELRLVDPRDQGHVAEDVRVACEVQREAILERDDEAAGLAGVRPVARRVEECWACVSVTVIPSSSTVPPLFVALTDSTP